MRCTRCGEPWDLDSLHDLVDERHPDRPWESAGEPGSRERQTAYDPYFAEAREAFYRDGCQAFNCRCYLPDDEGKQRGAVMLAAVELMGDDVDGIESMMQDAEAMGL